MEYQTKTIDNKIVNIQGWSVRELLDSELNKILGDKFRHVQNGILYQWDEFTDDNIPLREANDKEIELFDSFCNVMNYFISKEMEERM